MKTIEEVKSYFLEHDFKSYEKDNFDDFIFKTKFSYTIPSVHITGTNGKTCVATYLASIYESSHYKVGLFTSPYVDSPLEAIKINGKQIPLDIFLKLFNEGEKNFKKFSLTSFDILTYIAFSYFSLEKCNIAIIEVGMGGEIDATNIFVPILSIITNVNLEHTYYLGRSISEIAENKGGIIKKEIPVLIGKLDETAETTIRDIAKDLECDVIPLDEIFSISLSNDYTYFDYLPNKKLRIKGRAKYQLQNAAMAISATRILNHLFPVSEECLKIGLEKASIPLHYEIIGNVLLDACSNPYAAEELISSLKEDMEKPLHLLFSSLKDKNIDLMLQTLSRDIKDIIITTFDFPLARDEDGYFLFIDDYKFENDYRSAMDYFKTNFPGDVILVIGSLEFVGKVKEYLLSK